MKERLRQEYRDKDFDVKCEKQLKKVNRESGTESRKRRSRKERYD